MSERQNRSTSWLIGIILVEAVVIAALCLWLARLTRQEAARDTGEHRIQVEAQKRIGDLQAQIRHLQARPGPDAAKSPNRVTIYSSGSDYAANFLRKQASPEIAPLRTQVERVSLGGADAALFRFLHLPPEKISALRDLLVEEQEEQLDVRVEAAAQHITDRAEIDQLAAQDREELEAKIKDALGADSYAQLQYFRQTNPERGQVQQLQQTLSYTENPLTDAQGEQLVKLLADNAPAPAATPTKLVGSVAIVNGQTLVNGQVMGPAPTLTDTVMSQAAAFLSSGQLEALRAMQQAQQASAQMRAFLSRPEPPSP